MDPAFLIRGVLIGLSIAAPVGPIGVLCIRRTLEYGRWVGLATGLGAATADAVYGGVAGFGITVISVLLLSHQASIRLVGGVFLAYLGAKTFASAPAGSDQLSTTSTGILRSYSSAVALTLTNPTTILSFIAIFAGVGVKTGSASGAGAAAALLVLGVFLGSALWWVVLTTIVSAVRTRLTVSYLQWVNRLSGTILLGFGVIAIGSLFR